VGEKVPKHPKLFDGTWFAVDLVTVFWTLVVGLIIILISAFVVRKLDMRSPKGLQNWFEWAIEFTRNMARDTMPSEAGVRFVLPFAFVTLVYLFFANWMGLLFTVEFEPHHDISLFGQVVMTAGEKYSLLNSPTENMNMTLGLAILVWLVSHAYGLRHPLRWLKTYRNPMAIIDEITNPLTHGMRLFGNILAGEVLIEALLRMPMLFGWVPTGLPLLVIWLLYSAFVSTIQAYIFALLLTLYIGHKDFSVAHH
jgi:F-type H+-transporting ATPase subunit a